MRWYRNNPRVGWSHWRGYNRTYPWCGAPPASAWSQFRAEANFNSLLDEESDSYEGLPSARELSFRVVVSLSYCSYSTHSLVLHIRNHARVPKRSWLDLWTEIDYTSFSESNIDRFLLVHATVTAACYS